MENLLNLALIWAGVLISSFLAERTKLTPVLYFLAFGAVAVNTGLLPEESSPFIEGFSEVGIILIMFALGFEENSSDFLSSIRKTWGIALFGAIAPFVTAWYAALTFWGDMNLALICGLAMTATAVSLTMVSLRSEKLQTSRAATGIMTSAVLDDIGSLVLVAVLIPMVTGSGDVSLLDIELIAIKAVLFFALVSVIGMWILPHNIQSRLFSRLPFIQRYGLRHLLAVDNGEKSTLIILLVALNISMLAFELGFHPAVGAYMAGLIMKDEYFHGHSDTSKNSYEDTRRIIDDVAFSWIGPVFFVELGTKLVFDPVIFFSVIEETLILTVGLFISQVASAGLAARKQPASTGRKVC